MNIYVAARYSRRDEMREVAKQLIAAGAIVTSRWLHEDKPLQTNMGDDSDQFYTDTAQIDLRDILAADAVLFYAEDPLVGTPRGGRHVEFGYALGIGMRIFVVGPKENIFHYRPQVEHYDTLTQFLENIDVTY